MASALRFLNRQTTNFKVIVLQRMVDGFYTSLSLQYESLYMVALGATVDQVGFLKSLGTLSNAVISLPFGWAVDKFSQKKAALIAMLKQLSIQLAYGISWNWQMLVPAALLGTFWMSPVFLVTNVAIANNLKEDDRATGMALVNSFAVIPSIVLPVIAAYVLVSLGGISAGALRPLYWITIVLQGLVIAYTFFAMKEQKTRSDQSEVQRHSSVFEDFRSAFKGGTALKRLIAVQLIDGLSFGMLMPYLWLFVVEVKNATPFILGLAGITYALGALIFAHPIGKLGDSIGRRKTAIVIKFVYYLSVVLLILAPSSEWIVFSFLLRSMDVLFIAVWQTTQMESVPATYRGKWTSIILLFAPITGIPSPIIGSLVWTQFNPSSLLIGHIVLDLCLMLPIFVSIPETLRITKAVNPGRPKSSE